MNHKNLVTRSYSYGWGKSYLTKDFSNQLKKIMLKINKGEKQMKTKMLENVKHTKNAIYEAEGR